MISSLEKGAYLVSVRKKIRNGNNDSSIKKADMEPKAATWSSLHFLMKSITSVYRFFTRFDMLIFSPFLTHLLRQYWQTGKFPFKLPLSKLFTQNRTDHNRIRQNKPPHVEMRRLLKRWPKMPCPAILSPSLSQVGNLI